METQKVPHPRKLITISIKSKRFCRPCFRKLDDASTLVTYLIYGCFNHPLQQGHIFLPLFNSLRKNSWWHVARRIRPIYSLFKLSILIISVIVLQKKLWDWTVFANLQREPLTIRHFSLSQNMSTTFLKSNHIYDMKPAHCKVTSCFTAFQQQIFSHHRCLSLPSTSLATMLLTSRYFAPMITLDYLSNTWKRSQPIPIL